MEIVPLGEEMLLAAAELFVKNYRNQRQATPILPNDMECPERVREKLGVFLPSGPAFAALEGGRLVGYLAGFLIDHFRNTGLKGAYCPVWAHAALEGQQERAYRSLYRAAAGAWTVADCGVHAISLLAEDHIAREVWFWNGFGLAVVDAIRTIQPLGVPYPTRLHIRQAQAEDASALAQLEEEHIRHYAQPPVLMVPQAAKGEQEFQEFMDTPPNSVWIAVSGGELAGYIRFEGGSFGATEIVQSPTTIAITGGPTPGPHIEARGQPQLCWMLHYVTTPGWDLRAVRWILNRSTLRLPASGRNIFSRCASRSCVTRRRCRQVESIHVSRGHHWRASARSAGAPIPLRCSSTGLRDEPGQWVESWIAYVFWILKAR